MFEKIKEAALNLSPLRKKVKKEAEKPENEKPQIELDEKKIKQFKFGRREKPDTRGK